MQKMYYSLYQGKTPIYERDSEGNIVYITINGVQVAVDTGDKIDSYSIPVEFYANISASKGYSEDAVFGKSLDYTRVICDASNTLPINESSKIWLETEPAYNEDETVNINSADYDIKAIAKSLNGTLYAIKKLQKNAGV